MPKFTNYKADCVAIEDIVKSKFTSYEKDFSHKGCLYFVFNVNVLNQEEIDHYIDFFKTEFEAEEVKYLIYLDDDGGWFGCDGPEQKMKFKIFLPNYFNENS